MEIQSKYLILGLGVSLAAGALIQRQWDSKEIERAISEQKTITKNRIITVTKEITRPDGTKETDTTTTDNSIKKEIEKTIQEVSKSRGAIWMVSAGAAIGTDLMPSYKAQIDRQILGPIWVGIYATTHKEAGLSLGVQF